MIQVGRANGVSAPRAVGTGTGGVQLTRPQSRFKGQSLSPIGTTQDLTLVVCFESGVESVLFMKFTDYGVVGRVLINFSEHR